LKNHLLGLGEWSTARHEALTVELENHVSESWQEAVRHGALNEGPQLDPGLMFEDVFEHMSSDLKEQREQLRAEAL
jgi:2-oxoisovalerate dehydrogenase E1 component alpha subunit